MPRGLGAGSRVENLIIEVDVLDVERDVLLGLPVDRLGQLGVGHDRQADFLDDDGVARERGRDVLALERVTGEEPADRVADRPGVDDGAIDDAVGRNGLAAERRDPVGLTGRLQLDCFDRTRPDVEADDGFCFTETKHDGGSLSAKLIPNLDGHVPAEIRRSLAKTGIQGRHKSPPRITIMSPDHEIVSGPYGSRGRYRCSASLIGRSRSRL